MDKKAPQEVRNYLVDFYVRYGGPSGMTEQDDMENWNYAHAASRGAIARQYAYDYSQGIGRGVRDRQYDGLTLPGVVADLRMLSLSTDAAAVAAMQRIVPESFALETPPQAGLSGIREPVHALSYDLPLLAGAHLADDLVHRVAATLAEHGAELAGALADFRGFGPGTMARPVPCDYHTGAIRYYRERGIWPPG